MSKLAVAFTLLLAACGGASPTTSTTAANHGGAPRVPRPDALPPLTSDQVVLLAETPGSTVALTTEDDATREVPDGTLATRTDDGELALDGVTYVLNADVGDVLADRGPQGEAIATRNESWGDFRHVDVWYVPTLASRTLLVEGASSFEITWGADLGVLMHDSAATIIDLATGATTAVEQLGAPSFAPDGTLYYRTMDGGAWRWTGAAGTRIGDGAPGTEGSGDLNEGITDPEWPAAVTFSGGTPAWK